MTDSDKNAEHKQLNVLNLVPGQHEDSADKLYAKFCIALALFVTSHAYIEIYNVFDFSFINDIASMLYNFKN